MEIVIATPGRLIDFLESRTTNLKRVTYLVGTAAWYCTWYCDHTASRPRSLRRWLVRRGGGARLRVKPEQGLWGDCWEARLLLSTRVPALGSSPAGA